MSPWLSLSAASWCRGRDSYSTRFWTDRGALWEDDDGNPYKIAVTVVNKGRRPVILTMIGGTCRKGTGGGTYFDSKRSGIRLGEHEHHHFEIDKEGVVAIDRFGGPDEPYDFMWVEDTLGNRHEIPNSREYIARMYPANNQLNAGG